MEDYNNDTIPPMFMRHILNEQSIYCRMDEVLRSPENIYKIEERSNINNYLKLAKEQIRIAFEHVQKEVSDLRQRTREGIETARLNGKQIGHPKGMIYEIKKAKAAKEVIRKHNKSFGGSLTDAETMKQAGISRKSFFKYKRESREDTA